MDTCAPCARLLPDERLDRINENLSLIQKKGGLTFGTDAYLLAAFARPAPASVCVDLGAGSGVVSLLCLSRAKFRHACAVEIQEEYCDLIRRNAALNGMDARLTALCRDVRALSAAELDAPPSVVLSNPPYMPAGAGFSCSDERLETARRERNGTISDFCAAAARLLSSGGLFYTVYRPDRMTELLCALRAVHLEPKRMLTVYPDTATPPCLILVESKKDAAPSLRQAPPLIIYRDSAARTYTDSMQRIYDTFSLEFLFECGKEKRR